MKTTKHLTTGTFKKHKITNMSLYKKKNEKNRGDFK